MISSRSEAEKIVSAFTFKVNQYCAVSINDCFLLLGEKKTHALLSDPIRKLGPSSTTVYPWNVVDYLMMDEETLDLLTQSRKKVK